MEEAREAREASVSENEFEVQFSDDEFDSSFSELSPAAPDKTKDEYLKNLNIKKNLTRKDLQVNISFDNKDGLFLAAKQKSSSPSTPSFEQRLQAQQEQ